MANVMVGPVLGQIVQPRRDRTEHGGLLMPQLGFGAVLVVFDPGLPLGHYSWRGGWTGSFESQSFDHLLLHVRGSASIQSARELHRTVLLRIWSCLSRSAAFSDHLRLNLVPFFELLDYPLSVFLEALTVTSSPWTEALIPRAFSEYKHVFACLLRKPISSKKPPSSHSPF